MKAFVSGALVLCLFVDPLWAAEKDQSKEKEQANEISEILDGMGYPELQVVPRASERLRMEARAEKGNWFFAHWPVELSGLATLAVGLTNSKRDDLSANEKDNQKTVNMLTTGVGVGWIVGGVLLGAQKPYARGMRSVQRSSGKDERSALMRERLAEEALERPAKIMRVLQHVSVATNFTMNALSAVYADDQGQVMAGVAAVLSFLPYMFEDPSIAVHEKHIEYKRKIYTPVKGASLWMDPETKRLTPMTTLAWTF